MKVKITKVTKDVLSYCVGEIYSVEELPGSYLYKVKDSLLFIDKEHCKEVK